MSLDPSRTAPSSSSTFTPGLRKREPVTKCPLGMTSVPPPALAHRSIVDWMDLVLRVEPSATAPYSEISNRGGSAPEAKLCELPAQVHTKMAAASIYLRVFNIYGYFP